MEVDSILFRFNEFYEAERINGVRCLLEDKEKQILAIKEVLDEQKAIKKKIVRQVPITIQRSFQEEPKSTKCKGILGLLGKKKVSSTTTTMLYTLNHDTIVQQQAQSYLLSEHTDSLAAHYTELNRQLQGLILHINERMQDDLQKRENEITAMREESFVYIGTLTGFLFFLLVLSYIIIYRDTHRIRQYEDKTVSLIRLLHESDIQNKELISSRKKAMHTVTHELRTPLTAIHGYAELVQKHGTENTIRYAENILQASSRMTAMLNALLDFFRLDSGKERPNISSFSSQAMAESLKAEFMPQAEAKNLRLTIECSSNVILIGDKGRIMQICDNLLSKCHQIHASWKRVCKNAS